MTKITNIEDRRITLYRNLKFTPQSHIDNNFFIVEGEKTTVKLLESELEIISFFALDSYYKKFAELIKSKKIQENRLYYADKQVMNEIVGFKLHQGIMAIAKQPKETVFEKLSPTIVVMNGIINSENVGAIIRNAIAFNINSLIYDKATSNPFLRRSVRVSMGTVFDMKYYRSQNLINTLTDLKKQQGYGLIAVEINKRAKTIEDYHFLNKMAIIFGNEGRGIDEEILNICDEIIYIPINKNVPSINVAATSAIVFNVLNNRKF